jgi:hypothetical protein
VLVLSSNYIFQLINSIPVLMLTPVRTCFGKKHDRVMSFLDRAGLYNEMKIISVEGQNLQVICDAVCQS